MKETDGGDRKEKSRGEEMVLIKVTGIREGDGVGGDVINCKGKKNADRGRE